MKRLFLIFLVINIMLPATFSTAAEKGNTIIKNVVLQKATNAKAKQAEYRLLEKQITSNKIKLVIMKKDANNAFNRAKNRLKQLLKKKNNMTQEQIDLINEAIERLQLDSKALNDTSVNLNDMYLELENAKAGSDYQLIKQYMNDIIDLQKTRILNLQQAINDMNKIVKM